MPRASGPEPPTSTRCTHSSLQQRGAIALPVLADHNPVGGAAQIRKSRNAKKRAIVLGTVQFLIIVHIVLWLLSRKFGWWGGKTITPIEPSESMEFVKHGVINAGLIFFALALLATLILGRWFCGWGCHVVLLQDLCGWIMKKCGVRPKAFRSRFLVYVPLILAIYMFIMPAVHRWGLLPLDERLSESLGEEHALVQTIRISSSAIGFPVPYPAIPEWRISTHLTTPDFWQTFATVGVAIPFLFICGFAVVYFLGSKGFCTYGCPYGGFFTPIDRLSPMRIVVNDNCEHCGHCTAVCTSNVRVHEEVREYGMVVNPGCMKCLDCVSVCPNEALSFGFAKPSLLKGAPKAQKPKKAYDLTLGEEFAAAAVFLLSFVAVRGVYGVVPMLMAVGIAGIVTFLTWKLWRLVRDQHLSLHRYQLKLRGKVRRAGWIFAGSVAVVLLFTVHSGIVNALHARAQFYDDQITIPRHLLFAEQPVAMDAEMIEAADRGLRLYMLASSIREGGIGLLSNFWFERYLLGTWQTTIDFRRAWLLCAKHEFAAAEQVLRSIIDRDGPNDALVSSVMWTMEAQGRRAEAMAFGRPYLLEHAEHLETLGAVMELAGRSDNIQTLEPLLREIIERHGVNDLAGRALMTILFMRGQPQQAIAFAEPVLRERADLPHMLETFRGICMEIREPGRCIDLCRARLERFPDHLHTLRVLSVVLLTTGEREEGLRLTQRTLEIDPRNAGAHAFFAMELSRDGRYDQAMEALGRALRLQPRNVSFLANMAELLVVVGRADEAEEYRRQAQQLFERERQRAERLQQPRR